MTYKVGVLVVLYNQTVEEVRPLFNSLIKQDFTSFKLYIIDNGDNRISIDNEFNRDNQVLSSRGNIGFAHANNLLAREAMRDGCKYLFILNPDMELENNTIKILFKLLENNPDTAACSSVVLYGNDLKGNHIIQLFGQKINYKTQSKKFLFERKKWTDADLPEVKQVDFVNGGSLFIKSEFIKKYGLFNEEYFMYNDEIDLARRIKIAGYKILVTSQTRIWHHHDWSKQNIVGYKIMYYYMLRNRMLYFKKYKLLFYMLLDLFIQLATFPLKIKMFYRIGSLSVLKYYYLGMINGVLGESGKSAISFR